jgi:hypothetical protein
MLKANSVRVSKAEADVLFGGRIDTTNERRFWYEVSVQSTGHSNVDGPLGDRHHVDRLLG